MRGSIYSNGEGPDNGLRGESQAWIGSDPNRMRPDFHGFCEKRDRQQRRVEGARRSSKWNQP